MKKLVIIPAFNEEKNIDFVVADIRRHAPEFDYVIVNDCSKDGMRSLCRRQGYNYIDLPVNLGIGGCVQAGYLYAQRYGYDIAVQFDGDGQHNAAYLGPMYQAMIELNSDMIIGSRFIRRQGFQSSAMRRGGIAFLSWLIKCLSKKEIKDVTSGLRMVNRKVIADFCRYYPNDYPEPETLAASLRKGYQVDEFPVEMRERQGGASSINTARAVYYMVKVSLSILIDYFRR
ncbi:MAG: glycosyltransferase family 2 protein [Clostridia bacterium]|nr:glycosyltransferase family 2 protein [Clostridia bacterium]